MIRVLLVDDHPVVRKGLRALLDELPGVEPVGEAADGAEALRLLAEREADVVLMDLQMGPAESTMNGVEATRRIAALPDPPRVLVLTTYSTDADILAAVEAGATGYLLKDAPPEDLAAAITATARGETVLAPPVAARLLGRVRARHPALSPREQEVLGLIAEGLSNRQISRRLMISEATVKTHLVHLYDKLGVTNRSAAIAAALQSGLIRAARQ